MTCELDHFSVIHYNVGMSRIQITLVNIHYDHILVLNLEYELDIDQKSAEKRSQEVNVFFKHGDVNSFILIMEHRPARIAIFHNCGHLKVV